MGSFTRAGFGGLVSKEAGAEATLKHKDLKVPALGVENETLMGYIAN